MRDVSEWVSLSFGNRRNLQPRAQGRLGETLQRIVAKCANPASLTAGNGIARPIDDNSAQLLDCELGSSRPHLAEDGALLADVGMHKVIDTYPCAEPNTGALVHKEDLACANRRKDEFLAMLSHELRSPLATMRYAMRLLAGQVGEAQAQRRIQALMERQLGRMTRLVDDLLDVSRITSGRMHLQRERIDLRIIVSNAIEALESDITEHHHRLATTLPETPLWLLGDRCRLEQVFINLLANAVRYTDAGGELTVWVHAREGQAVVRVRDSGIGIPPDALPHIFDLFKQVNGADRRSAQGLGVGLAVVRDLVALHGGSVTAASAGPGQGSEFTVRLPTES
jgi:signal transduction histidine kinase